MEKQNMELYIIALVARYGIEVATIILKNMQGVTTIDEAIAKLGAIKTTNEYIQESATRLGTPARPLGQ